MPTLSHVPMLLACVLVAGVLPARGQMSIRNPAQFLRIQPVITERGVTYKVTNSGRDIELVTFQVLVLGPEHFGDPRQDYVYRWADACKVEVGAGESVIAGCAIPADHEARAVVGNLPVRTVPIRGPALRRTWAEVEASWARLEAERPRRLAESRARMLAAGVYTRAGSEQIGEVLFTDLFTEMLGVGKLSDGLRREHWKYLKTAIWKIVRAEVDFKRRKGRYATMSELDRAGAIGQEFEDCAKIFRFRQVSVTATGFEFAVEPMQRAISATGYRFGSDLKLRFADGAPPPRGGGKIFIGSWTSPDGTINLSMPPGEDGPAAAAPESRRGAEARTTEVREDPVRRLGLEGSAAISVLSIALAEYAYRDKYGRFASLEQLRASRLLPRGGPGAEPAFSRLRGYNLSVAPTATTFRIQAVSTEGRGRSFVIEQSGPIRNIESKAVVSRAELVGLMNASARYWLEEAARLQVEYRAANRRYASLEELTRTIHEAPWVFRIQARVTAEGFEFVATPLEQEQGLFRYAVDQTGNVREHR